MTFNLENQHCAPLSYPQSFLSICTFLHGIFQKDLENYLSTNILKTHLPKFENNINFSFFRQINVSIVASLLTNQHIAWRKKLTQE